MHVGFKQMDVGWGPAAYGGVSKGIYWAAGHDDSIASEKKTPSISRREVKFNIILYINCLSMNMACRLRVWSRPRLRVNRSVEADQPSSHMSVVSALHAELERAQTQVNYLMQEQRNRDKVHHLIKCFAEEKMSWKRSSSSHQPSSHMLGLVRKF
ncbi:hypothetical protein SASPL_150232 [Salvia splendens]|uniref:Uncharacterized protein n=1 Tax=Salvia splendens TaxID=180675 RepID=A0A8X8Z1U2_SALSN|nr:hypothetical protein SASPL_150232 [Salvia splendens]